MVEKAGHKNQLRLKRIQWIDEGRPRAAGELQDGDDDDLFGDSNQPEERDPAIFPARIAPMFQNSVDKRARTPAGDDPFAADDDIYDASPRRPTTTAPATTSSMFGNGGTAQADGEPDEDDLDALMAEEEEAQRTTTTSSLFGNGKTTVVQRVQTSHGEPGDDDDLDALMAEAEAESSTKKPANPANGRPAARAVIEDEEDDLDALMAEAEAEAEGSMAKKPPSQGPGATNTNGGEPSAHEVDEDAEAAMAEMEGLW